MSNRALPARIGRAIILILLMASVAQAGTISVPGDSPSIKGAMIKAKSGDIVLVSCGTYFEFDITVKPGVSLWSGTLQSDCVTIDARGQGRCLIFTAADSTTSIVGITFRGGQASSGQSNRGGAILCQDAAPRFTRCSFADNRAHTGGALAVEGRRGPSLDQCVFENNTANSGGAIAWNAETGLIKRCTFTANNAQLNGGAIASEKGQLKLIDCLLANNSAGNSGGALSLLTGRSRIENTVFINNLGGLAGGAISASQAQLTLRNCTLHANDADGEATVLSCNNSHPVIEACLITGSANPLFSAVASEFTISGSNILPLGNQEWPAIIANWSGAAGNLSLDPMYCAPESGDLHLQEGSPSLQKRRGQQIGALSQGCGAQFP